MLWIRTLNMSIRAGRLQFMFSRMSGPPLETYRTEHRQRTHTQFQERDCTETRIRVAGFEERDIKNYIGYFTFRK